MQNEDNTDIKDTSLEILHLKALCIEIRKD